MNEPKVVAVIPIWNRIIDTLECLNSLSQQSYCNLEVVVIDNGSQDSSAEEIAARYPHVMLIRNPTNLGTVEAENMGMIYALEHEADYLAILNNDITFEQNTIKELIHSLEEDVSIAVAGPKVYYYDQPDIIWAAGGMVNFSEVVSSMRGYNQKDRGQYDEPVDVDYIPSCALVVRASVVREVGLLDPVYFAYFDDPDWCWRIRQHGYRIRYVPSAKIWHKVSRTAGSYSPQACYALGVNAVIFMKKYAVWHEWVKWFFYAVFSLPFLYVVRLFQGKGKSVLAKAMGIWDGFRGARVTKETFQRNW